MTCADGETRCFVNIAEVGLGAAVVAKAAGLTGAGRFLGGARYAAGFWLTLPRFRPAAVRLDANGQYHAWRAFNVVVANCRFYGGGMQISPNSDPGDCLLDILVMTGPKSDSFTTLPKVYSGRAPAAPQHRRAAGRPAERRGGALFPGRGRRGTAGHDTRLVRDHSRRDPAEGVRPRVVSLVRRT